MGKFKPITAETYSQPNFPGVFVVQESDSIRPISHLDYIKLIDEIRLEDVVPSEVSDLFEVAKGMAVYAYLYYPLFTSSAHYALLAVEAALYLMYRKAGGRNRRAQMAETRSFLERKGLLPEGHGEILSIAKELRNELSHPKFATITGQSFGLLRRSADLINGLYARAI